jgi:HSP20 family protein
MKLVARKFPAPLALAPELDRFIDHMFGAPFFNMPMTPVESAWIPVLDYSETEKAYVCRLEVPGIPKENLDLNLVGQVLTVSGHREINREQENEAFFVQERQVGRFVRSIRLPGPVAEDKVEATVNDGVMAITLPKLEVTPKSRITIK